jgi:Zn finger protein HypA/HybF involved in hydrogenase expression
LKRLRPLQAKLAGLAGEAVEFAKFVKAEIESLPIGFKQTIVVAVDGKHQVRSLLDLLERVDGFIHDHAAADLVAAAVGERCEECDGEGVLSHSNRDCPTCGGKGTLT